MFSSQVALLVVVLHPADFRILFFENAEGKHSHCGHSIKCPSCVRLKAERGGFLPQIVRSPRWMASRFALVSSQDARAVSIRRSRASAGGPFRQPLFDHLVGAGKQRRWHFEAEGLRGFEVDH